MRIKTNQELQEILNDNDKVIVDFSAPWCGPCNRIAPTFKELSEKYPDISFIEVDMDDENSQKDFNIKALPTFLFYCEGKNLKEINGADKNRLIQYTKELSDFTIPCTDYDENDLLLS